MRDLLRDREDSREESDKVEETEQDNKEDEERPKRDTGYGYGAVSVVSVGDVISPMCVQKRTRGIEREPSTGGRQCSGQGYEERYCSDSNCQG